MEAIDAIEQQGVTASENEKLLRVGLNMEEVKGQIERVESKIEEVESKIEEVESKIEEVESKIEIAKAKEDKEEWRQLCRREEQLCKREDHLRDELKQLRDELKQLRDEKLKLMDITSWGGGTAGAGVVMEYLKEMKDSMKGMKEMKDSMKEIKDAVSEKFSVTRQASKINANDLALMLTKMKLIVVEAAGSPGIDALIGRDVSEDDVNFWGEEPEPQQRDAYATLLKEHLSKARGPSQLMTVPEKNARRLFMEGFPFAISGKNDELVVPRRFCGSPDIGALFGIELKKRISRGSLLQAQAEWLLYAHRSIFPYIQLVTDMQKGGVAYYFAGKMGNGLGLLEYRVLPTIDHFWEFIEKMTIDLPKDIGGDAPNNVSLVLPQELETPKRLKFTLELSPEVAYKTLANYFNNIDDVANLADLEGFPEIDMVGPVDQYPSYFS